MIIEQLDPSGDLFRGYLTGWELFPVDQLDLEEPVCRFRQRVIEATPGSPDRTRQTEPLEYLLIVIGGVVTAPVRMCDRTFGKVEIAGSSQTRV